MMSSVTTRVASPRPADKYLGPLVSRLRGVNQPGLSIETHVQPLVSPRWPASEPTAALACQAHQVGPWLRPSATGATAVPDTAPLRAASRRGLSIPLPAPACPAAPPCAE